MDNLIFKNAGELWTIEEDTQLNNLYNIDMLDITEISKINNRAPGSIISRLHKHNYISNRQSARGYSIYKNSDLYKEIVSKNNTTRIKKTDTLDKPENLTKKPISLQNDVKEMKNEIKELKNTIKELVEMMKAVYEFEDA